MAKITLDPMMGGLSGKFGGIVFRSTRNGVIMSHLPRKSDAQPSDAQKAQRQRFREAAAYARHAAKELPIYAELAAKARTQTAYCLAMSDWFEAPVIHRIMKEDGYIFVVATDNVVVANVQVTTLDADGNVLESGEAVCGYGYMWKVDTHVDGKTIVAEAWDLPGHVTRFELQL